MKEEDKKGNFLVNYFKLRENNTTVKIEVIAGITTFITIAYILILNPIILSEPVLKAGDMVMRNKLLNGIFIGTCLSGFLGTILVSLYAKLPLAQATGMGLNAFFAYTVCLGMGYTYWQALVIVFISGVLFIFITLVGLREAIIRSIPNCIKAAVTPGIGLFITIIGLKNSGIIVKNEGTLIAMVDLSKWSDPDKLPGILSACLAFIGLCTMAILHYKKVKGSIILGILFATVVGIPMGITTFSGFNYNLGNQFKDFFEVSFFKLDFAGLIKDGQIINSIFTITMLVISFSLVNMFDSIATLLGAAKQSGLIEENGEIKNMKQALMADAISTAAGAFFGTSTVTTVVESSAGIAAGGKTGLTSFVTALLLLGSILLAPIVGIVPTPAIAPALVFVGILMLSNIKDVDFSDMTEALPAFCTIVFMPFTYSIANGVGIGLITYCITKAAVGKFKDVKLLTFIVAMIFIVRYVFITQ